MSPLDRGILSALEPGDTVMFYTDGVVECTDPKGEDSGIERLTLSFVAARQLPAHSIINAVVKATREHCGSQVFSDDFNPDAAAQAALAPRPGRTDQVLAPTYKNSPRALEPLGTSEPAIDEACLGGDGDRLPR